MAHYVDNKEFLKALVERRDKVIEAKRLGLKVLLPHVNESDIEFSLQGNSIRFGLADIKFISESISNKLIPVSSVNSFRFYFNQAKRKAKVGKRFHDTRHTFASRMTEKGWSVTELAQQGGWKQLQVLKRYTHINAKILAKKLG